VSELRVKISSSSILEQFVTPVWGGIFSYVQEKGQIFFRKRLKGAMVFQNTDYELLNAALNPLECEIVTVTVEIFCGEPWAELVTAKFTLLESVINLDSCFISVTPEIQDDYTCFLKAWKEPINIYALDIVAVRVYDNSQEYYVECFTEGPAGSPPPLEPVVPADPGTEWCVTPENNYIWQEETNVWYHTTCYHRLQAAGTCSGATPVAPYVSAAWNLLTDNCPTDSIWWRCPGTDEAGGVNGALSTGRDFSDVLAEVFGICGLNVVSDFFNINPDATAPSNAAYDYATLYYQLMTVHQKSDVKRPYNSDPAKEKAYDIKPADLLNDLRILFNVYGKITGNEMRLEHISYFTETADLDLTASPGQKLETEADPEDRIFRENFFYADEQASALFVGQPIFYDCGSEVFDNRCVLFSCDVTFIQYNANNDSISDAGFVLCSTKIEDDLRVLVQDNTPLAFTNLHENLHRHNRQFPTGTLNGDPVTFTTYKPVRKQPEFKFVSCCGVVFDPVKPKTTALGTGYVQSGAEYDAVNDTITVQLKY
jgi:hypothetical protein